MRHPHLHCVCVTLRCAWQVKNKTAPEWAVQVTDWDGESLLHSAVPTAPAAFLMGATTSLASAANHRCSIRVHSRALEHRTHLRHTLGRFLISQSRTQSRKHTDFSEFHSQARISGQVMSENVRTVCQIERACPFLNSNALFS